jgi:aminoglycoside 2''-phosphotransferase
MAGDHDGHDFGAIRREVVRIAPEFSDEPNVRLGEGMDSVAVLAGGTAVFRFAKHEDAAAGLRREIALLPRLAPRLSLAIPRIEYVGEHSSTGLPFVGYGLIAGQPLHPQIYDRLPEADRSGVLGDLASFLTAVHGFPVEDAIACGVDSSGTRSSLVEDLQRARHDVFPHVDGAVRRTVESELEAFVEDDANFNYAPALLHADLWPEHVLFSEGEGRLTGVIDFGDVSIGDPDYDLAFLGHRLGSEFVVNLLRYLPHDDPARLFKKIRCFACFNTIEDILIRLDRGDRLLIDLALADLNALARSWEGEPPGHGPIRLGRSLALPDSRKSVKSSDLKIIH